nr:hypothetical protein [Lelliottia steviae]
MKYKLILMLAVSALFIANDAAAALTEAKACDTCDYSEALRIAKLYYERPNCEVRNLNDGKPEFGVTTYLCNTTSKEVIVANALQRVAFKFIITTEQQTQYSKAVKVKAIDTTLNSAEAAALDDFYEIDSEFRRAVNEAGTVTTNSTVTVHAGNWGDDSTRSTLASSDESCANHPSFYLTSIDARRSIKKEMHAQIATRLGKGSWNEFITDTQVKVSGIHIGKNSAGISLSLSHDKVGVYATRSYGNSSNKLVFKVSYGGESITNGKRDLNLKFTMDRGFSLVDGIEIGTFMSGINVTLTDTLVSNCLIENLESIEGATTQMSSPGGGGIGGIVTGLGGGTLIRGGGCTREINYTTCSTSGGVTTCTNNSVRTGC